MRDTDWKHLKLICINLHNSSKSRNLTSKIWPPQISRSQESRLFKEKKMLPREIKTRNIYLLCLFLAYFKTFVLFEFI